jgi:hypothetical protein
MGGNRIVGCSEVEAVNGYVVGARALKVSSFKGIGIDIDSGDYEVVPAGNRVDTALRVTDALSRDLNAPTGVAAKIKCAFQVDHVGRLRTGSLGDHGIGCGVGDLNQGRGNGLHRSWSGKDEQTEGKNYTNRKKELR